MTTGPVDFFESEEDREDMAILCHGMAGYLDRVVGAIRAEGDPLTVRGAAHNFTHILRRDDFLERIETPRCLTPEEKAAAAFLEASMGQLDRRTATGPVMDLMRLALAAVFERLQGLDAHEFLEQVRQFEAAARKAGRLRDDLRVFLLRIARLVIFCHDQERLSPLLDVEEVLRALWSLLDGLLALAALTAAGRPSDLGAETEALRPRRSHEEAREPPPGAFCRSHPIQRHAPPRRALVSTAHEAPRGSQFAAGARGGAPAPT